MTKDRCIQVGKTSETVVSKDRCIQVGCLEGKISETVVSKDRCIQVRTLRPPTVENYRTCCVTAKLRQFIADKAGPSSPTPVIS